MAAFECAGRAFGFRPIIGVGRTCNRLGMRPYRRKPEPLVEVQISSVEGLQITLHAGVVGLGEGRFNESRSDA
jgi:hypothetical protein